MAKAPVRPQGGEPQGDEGTPSRPAPDAALRSSVLRSLGQPPGLYQVAVLPLWRGHYRVNVLTGADATSVRIAHSFFVETTEAGDILTTTPRITRLYE